MNRTTSGLLLSIQVMRYIWSDKLCVLSGVVVLPSINDCKPYSAVQYRRDSLTLFGCLAECGIVCSGWCECGLCVSQFEIV